MTTESNRSGGSPKPGDVRLQVSNGSKLNPGAGSRPSRLSRLILVGLLSIALIALPSIGFAGQKAAETGREGGLGAAAAVSSLVYAPVKLVYATGGLIVGAFAWVFTAGDTEVADRVFTRSLRGTYVITPDILTGQEELLFIGRDVRDVEPRSGVLASASSATAAIEGATESTGTVVESYPESDYDEMGW